MTENYLHSVGAWLITFQLGLLAGLLGLIGKRIFQRLDELVASHREAAVHHAESMAEMRKEHSDGLLEIYKAMKSGDDQLHDRVTGAFNRISRLEASCEIQHKVQQ